MNKTNQTSLFNHQVNKRHGQTAERDMVSFIIEEFEPKYWQKHTSTINYSFTTSQFGNVLIASTNNIICYIAYHNDKTEALSQVQKRFPKGVFSEEEAAIHQTAVALLNGIIPVIKKIHLYLAGTPFQLKVWDALLNIPFGKTTTYGKLAVEIEQPQASRAVGTAIGKNPIALLIPCHRVVQATGKIGGYMWGTERKKAILAWEAKEFLLN